MKKLWIILPIAIGLLPILIEVCFLVYYNSYTGDRSNWPSPGSPTYWYQYVLLATTSLCAVVLNAVGIAKNSIPLKVICSLLLISSLVILGISASWIISPTPY